jgi:hypothetical protein
MKKRVFSDEILKKTLFSLVYNCESKTEKKELPKRIKFVEFASLVEVPIYLMMSTCVTILEFMRITFTL